MSPPQASHFSGLGYQDKSGVDAPCAPLSAPVPHCPYPLPSLPHSCPGHQLRTNQLAPFNNHRFQSPTLVELRGAATHKIVKWAPLSSVPFFSHPISRASDEKRTGLQVRPVFWVRACAQASIGRTLTRPAAWWPVGLLPAILCHICCTCGLSPVVNHI